MGMTEAGLTLGYPVGDPYHYTPREEMAASRVGESPGRVLTHGMSYRIVDPETGDPTETGELQLRGDSVFEGYLNDPDATDAAFTSDGWYRTGDIVQLDGDGYVSHVDRADNLIVTGGENVSPRKVEGVLRDHPNVDSAVVFGVPDDRWGRRVCAIVVGAADLSASDIRAYCKKTDRLAAYEVPKDILVGDELPRDESGDVDRERAAAEFESRS
jgi:feruloyl-CoA synthase